MNKELYNGSGYKDPTPYQAIKIQRKDTIHWYISAVHFLEMLKIMSSRHRSTLAMLWIKEIFP